MINKFLLALQFITTIPVNKELDYQEEAIANSMLFYPLIGSLLGLLLVGVDYLAQLYLSTAVASSLLMILLAIITGGIHLDGLMDSSDGLFSGQKRDQILVIMRDSRVGAFGVVAVVLILFLKFNLLLDLTEPYRIAALLLFPTLSRWAMVYAVFNYPYARKEGLGMVYKEKLTKISFVIATAWAVILAIILFRLKAIIILSVSFFSLFLITNKINNKLNGLTGDSYGAINELIEVVVLLLIIILQ